MPKRLYQLNDFSGGLNTVKDIADIADNEVGEASGIMFNIYGGIQPSYSMGNSTNNKIATYSTSFTDSTCDFHNDPTIAHDANTRIVLGMTVSAGAGIPANSFVKSVTSSTSFELGDGPGGSDVSTTGGSKTNQTLTFATGVATVQPGYGLGYFETDFARDPVTVSQTSSITGDDDSEGSATGFIARLNNSSYIELEYKVSGTQQNLASSFPVGTFVHLTASAFPADGISSAGQGIYRVVDTNGNNIIFDRAIALNVENPPQHFWGATLTGSSMGDQVLLLSSPSDHTIDTFSINSSTWELSSITLRSSATSIASKVKYYKVEDSIRCCDTVDKNDCKIQWYGWIQRRHFVGANSSDDDNSYMNYFSKDNDLSKPTDGKVASSSGTVGVLASFEKNQDNDSSNAISLTTGSGFNVSIVTETDVDGLIASGTYEFAQTFVYDGNQESLPSAYSDTLTVSEANEFKSLSLNIATVGPYDPRISGGRIYIREQGTDSEYVMLLDADLGKGCRVKLSDEYTSWSNISETLTGNVTDGSADITNTSNDLAVAGMSISGTGIPDGATITTANNLSNVITISSNATATGSGETLTLSGSFYSCPDRTVANNFSIKELGFITYEVINGFSSSIFSNAFGDSGEHWKDAVVANNRVFVCNVTMKDEDTGETKADATLRSYPDRIMYSMPNRYDTFPSTNFIEAAKGDADVYVAIEAYADRLLAYKNKSLDIINIAGDDRNWFLEDSKKYQGVLHPEAVKKTQYGVIWANRQGLYLYNGSSITNLRENKISDSDWNSHVGGTTGIIYDEQESMAFVVKSLDNDGDAYMCDLKKGNFTLISDFVLDSNDGLTNSVDTESNNTLIAHDSGSQIDIYQLNRTVVPAPAKFKTKALSFGDIHQVKKIYAIYITYKSNVDLTDVFTLLEADNNEHDLGGTVSASATNWANAKLTPQSPVVCNKASFRLNTSSSNVRVYINDIAVEYRTLYKKGT